MPPKKTVKVPALTRQIKTTQAAKKLPGSDIAAEMVKDIKKIRKRVGETKETLRGRLEQGAGDRKYASMIVEAQASGVKDARTTAAKTPIYAKLSTKAQDEMRTRRADRLSKAESDVKLATKARKIEEGREARISESAKKERTRLLDAKFPRPSGGGGGGGMGPGRAVVKQPRP